VIDKHTSIPSNFLQLQLTSGVEMSFNVRTEDRKTCLYSLACYRTAYVSSLCSTYKL